MIALKNKLQIFRPKDWYSSKATGLAGLLFVFALKFNLGIETFSILLFPAFITLTGIAALGYLINDYSDIESDTIAGKRNFFISASFFQKLNAFLVALVMAILPWYWLPYNAYSFGLLAIELVLFVLYSIEPVRLKKRPQLGILADTLYAHVIPVALAGYTFWLASKNSFPFLFFAGLIFWQFFAGWRNILQHHISDRKPDKKSGVYNAFNHHPEKTVQLISNKILWFELVFFSVFLMSLGKYGVFIFLGFVLFLIGALFTWRNAVIWRAKTRLKTGIFSPAFFYEHRLGLLAGFFLMFQNVWFGMALAIYILVFQVDLKSIFANGRVLIFKVLVIPIYRIIIQPYYKYVVTPYHHVFLKNAYFYGHKIKVWLKIKKPQS